MAVALRLYRVGKKGAPSYRIVVVAKRYKSNGSYVEEIGKYESMTDPAFFKLNRERYEYWVSRGAVVSEGLRKLLKHHKS